jgi:hypothetical protein
MLPALFAIGARMGGSPQVGTGALQGARDADLMAERTRAQRVAEGQRQQQVDMQRQQYAAQEVMRAQQLEERKQAAIGRAVDDLRAQKFPTREAYEQAISTYENLIGQQYPLRPHTLRTLVPFTGPGTEQKAYDVIDKMAKSDNWTDIVGANALITFDRDGDGIPERVPVKELIELGKYPIAQDPVTGQPMVAPKGVKAENVQEFDVAYQGVLAEWKAEGKDIANPAVQGKAALEARKRIATVSRQVTTSIVMPKDPATQSMAMETRQARLENIRLNNERIRSQLGGLTPGQKSEVASIKALRDLAAEVRRIGEENDWAGTGGLGVGSIKDWMAKNLGRGSKEEVLLRSKISNLIADIAKLRGGTSFTPNEQTLLERYAPTINEEPLSLVGKLEGLQSFLEQKLEATYSTTGRPAPGGGSDLRSRAKQILQQGGYDTSDAAVDKFLANPKNKALLGGGQ